MKKLLFFLLFIPSIVFSADFEFLVKVGDQQVHDEGFKDGMMVNFKQLPHDGWGKNELNHFAVIRINNITKDEAHSFVDPPKDEDIPVGFWNNASERSNFMAKVPKERSLKHVLKYRSNKFVTLSDIFTAREIADLRDHNTQVEIKTIEKSLLKPTTNYNFSRSFIPGSVSSGTHTVGSGKDYSLLSSAVADMTNLTGDLTFDVQTGFTDTAGCTFTENLNSYTFTITASEGGGARHSGYWDNTIDIVVDTTGQNYIYDASEGPGEVHISWLSVTPNSSTTPSFRLLFYSENITTAHFVHIYNNLVNGEGSFSGGNQDGIDTNDSTGIYYIYNNVVWDMDDEGIDLNDADSVAENNTVYSCDTNGFDGGFTSTIFRNNVAFDNGTDFAQVSGSTGTNNACSDLTCEDADFSSGSGNQDSLTTASEVDSTTDTNSGFMKVTSGSNINDGGTTGTYATTDIRGNTRSATWDVGADEYQAGGGGGSGARRRIIISN